VDENALLEGVAGGCTAVENDARCFTLAEAHYGAGRGQRDVCGIPLGTGVGCGVMIGGRLHRGAAFQSGEVWSLAQRGEHLEHFLSGAGVVRGYLAAGGVAGDGVDAEAVERRARAGEPAALAAWRAFGDDLSALCQSIVALLDPAVIVIGGSLSTARDLFGPALAAGAAIRGARLCGAKLGAAAGVIGAAALLVDGA
jgi:glucokinase